MHTEVAGLTTDPLPHRALTGYRIDRILVPGPKAREAGWDLGAIGIELKRSGADLGRLMTQAADYAQALWVLPGWIYVRLGWVFVYPADGFAGPLAALAMNARVGYASRRLAPTGATWPSILLKLSCGCINPLTVTAIGNDVSVAIQPVGRLGANRGHR